MIKKGQSVKVKPDTKNYESGKYDISGWEGRVIDIEKDKKGVFVEVQWDSITLANMPFEFIADCVGEDFEYEHYILLESDLMPCAPRDTEADVHSAQAKITNDYFESEE